MDFIGPRKLSKLFLDRYGRYNGILYNHYSVLFAQGMEVGENIKGLDRSGSSSAAIQIKCLARMSISMLTFCRLLVLFVGVE